MQRGLSYYGSHFTDAICNDLDEIAEIADYIVYAVSEFMMNFYPGAIQTVVSEAHKRNLAVYLDLWAFGGALGGEADSRFLMEHPETRQVQSNGVYAPRACFNNPLFKDYLASATKKLLALAPFDGVIIDEPHFHKNKKDTSSWSCRCTFCQKFFTQQMHSAQPQELSKDVLHAKSMATLQFVTWFSRQIKKIQSDMPVSLCITPPSMDSAAPNVEEYFKIPDLDIIGSDPYWIYFKQPLSFVTDVSTTFVALAEKYDKKVEMWVQAYKLPAGAEEAIPEVVRRMKEAGCDFINAWTFRCGENSVLECENHKKAWALLKRAYKEVNE